MICVRARLLLLFFLLLGSAGARAEIFCVDSVEQLRSALTEAASNQEPDTVVLRRGHYVVDQPLSVTVTDGYGLYIYGQAGELCYNLQYLPPNPALTILDGQNAGPLLDVNLRGASDFWLFGLTLRNGRSSQRSPVAIYGSCNSHGFLCWTGQMRIEHNHFLGNVMQASSGNMPAILLGSLEGNTHGYVVVRNNVFSDNRAYANTISVHVRSGWNDAGHVYHNTIYNNWSTATGSGNVGGMRFLGSGQWHVTNNIFWGNSGHDLEVGANVNLRYNNIQNRLGQPVISDGNLSVNPQFASGSTRLRSTSPMIDVATEIPSYWGGNGHFDAWGGLRLVGSHRDIGAHEWTEHIFGNDFELFEISDY